MEHNGSRITLVVLVTVAVSYSLVVLLCLYELIHLIYFADFLPHYCYTGNDTDAFYHIVAGFPVWSWSLLQQRSSVDVSVVVVQRQKKGAVGQRHSFEVAVVPVDACPFGQLGFVLPAGALVLPGVQVHDQILRLRVPVAHLALVAVLVRGHLVRVER